MKCPKCKAEFDLKSSEKVEEKINSFGNKEFVFVAKGVSWIKYEDGFYKCLRCGFKFSFQEGTLQK